MSHGLRPTGVLAFGAFLAAALIGTSAAAQGNLSVTVQSDDSIPPFGEFFNEDTQQWEPSPTTVTLIDQALPPTASISDEILTGGGSLVLAARTKGKVTDGGDPTFHGSYTVTFYFRPDAIVSCPPGGGACSPPIDATFYGLWGGATGSVLYEDGTPPEMAIAVQAVAADPESVPSELASEFAPVTVNTNPGTSGFVFTSVAAAPPGTCQGICKPIALDPNNYWALRVLGDGGAPDPSKEEPIVGRYSNGPGTFNWKLIVDHENLDAPLEQIITVVSSQATFVPTFQIPLKPDDEEDQDNREQEDDSTEGDEEARPPHCPPSDPCCEAESAPPPTSADHPVSLFTGNVFLDQVDVVLPGLRHDVVFRRSYNHRAPALWKGIGVLGGVLGPGWNHNFDKQIQEVSQYILRLWMPNGTAQYFTDPDQDGVMAPYGNPSGASTIQRTPTGYRRDFRTGGFEEYDLGGKLLVRADRVGRAISFSYDQNSKLAEILTPEGRKLTLEYSSGGTRLLRLLGPEGVVAEYDYFASGPLETVRYSDGTGYRFTYDSQQRLLTVADLEGVVLDRHGYDDQNRAAWSELSQGRERRAFTYAANQTLVTDANGNTTTYDWIKTTPGRRITRIAGPCGQCGGGAEERRWEYDDEGRVERYIDGDGNTTTYTWVGPNVEAVTVADAAETFSYTTTYGNYDALGRPQEITRPGIGTTLITWAAEGPHTVTVPTTPAETTTITYLGQRIKTLESPGGLIWDYEINDLGEVVSMTDPRNETTTYTYDVMSRLETLTGPDGRTLTLERGPLGRVEAVRRTDGEATRFEYDASGRLARVIDPAEHVQEYTYDEFNRLVATLDPRQRVTRYAYGLMSDLRSLTDAEGRTTEFVPDAFGRVERTINPLNQVERYEYYPSGRLRLREDRNGIQTVYTYDPLGRLVGKTYSDGTPAWSAVYEDAARRVTYANGTATVVRVLDEAGRLVSETSTVSGSGTSSTVTYTYNTDGQRETVSLDGSQIASYTYVDGFLDTIDSGEAQPFDFDYDELGRRTTLTYPNGVVTSYSYHPTLGWLTGIQAVKDAASILDVSYDHDLIGNRTEKSVDGLTEAYEYDAKSQLVAVQRTSPEARSWEYEYDGVGNRLVERVDDMPSTWTYDDANRVLARAAGGSVRVAGTTSEAATVTLDGQPATSVGGQGFEGEIEAPAGTSTFEVQATDASGNPRTSTYEFDAGTGSATYDYDANGNLIEKVEGGETWTYEWNAEGQLTRVLKDSVEVASFRYGPLGRRVERVAGSVTHSYIYDGIDILRASIDDGSVATTYTYVHGPGLDEPVVREEDSGTRSYYHADGLGSVVATTDAAGAVMSQREYDAWGNIEVGSADSGYAFTGREWDPETGLVYYRGRYHDPASGRFLSEDPLGAGGGGSRYAYVKNNPAVFIDPLGLQACLYDIPSGRMTCSDPGGNVVHDSRDWVSGLGGPCQNNPTPDCVSQKDVGPLPPGTYTSTGKPGHRPASTTRRNLTPDPSTKTHGRSAFQTHGCGNTATCSIGCAAQPDAQVMNDFNGFVDANPNTRVDATGYTGVGGPGLAGYVLARLRDLF